MKLGLLWLLVQKARKIYFYEQSPRTEEQYIETRNRIKKEISEIEQEYATSCDPKLKNKLQKLNVG